MGIVIYVIFILLGLFLGFSLQGLGILVLGAIISSIAQFVFNDPGLANIVAYISVAITVYIFITRET